MVGFDLELVPQGLDPENGATNKLEHKNTDKSENGGRLRMRHDMERCAEIETWGENKQDFGVRISAGELEDNVKMVGPRAGTVSGRVCQVRSTEMIVDSDRHEWGLTIDDCVLTLGSLWGWTRGSGCLR